MRVEEMIDLLDKNDPEVAAAIKLEYHRQNEGLELIASENCVSKDVLLAAGSILTNKYAEGYPGKRYYGGCQYVDLIENLAIERAKKLFGASYVNVQPHSGAQANTAVYFALLTPGDTVMGMSLADGGHLTHGSPVNLSGKYYNFIPYGLDEKTQRIDYNQFESLAKEHRPKLIVAGASAYPRTIDFERMAKVAHEVGALFMVDMAHIAGLVAAGEHPSPIPYADITTTTTHKTLRGPRGGMILTNSEELAKKINKAVFPGIQGGPLMHIIAAKAVCFGEALKPEFKEYQHRVVEDCRVLGEEMVNNGFNLVSGGTDNHLILVDLRSKNVTGKEFERRLGEVHITVNKNAIPNDPESPNITSGVRMGTAALAARGMGTEEMKKIAKFCQMVSEDFEANADTVRAGVAEMCKKFPLYD